MGKISQSLHTEEAHIIEQNNRDLANHINKMLHNYLDLTLPKKISLLTNIKEIKKSD